ncbi:MAG: putative acyl-CoA transferase/carnitine dehydratase [Marmoricola sp.]|nr:putative acyl-CoA transferase/carnitine dehydratase [Marmoricola sp.]
MHKPLQNIRILELGGYISGPYGTSLLCALGADVVKVEKPGAGDDFRRQDNDRSPYFIQYNAGKRSLAVDLKDPDGVALVKALIPRFDVLLENVRPGKLTALGLGPDACRALRPDLIYTSVSGFGEGGPLRDRPAYDTIGQAFGGLYTLLGDEGSPQLSGAIFADLVTGLSTATGILAALVGRSTTGTGQLVQTSIMEAVSTVTVDAFTQYFDRNHSSPSRESRHPQAQNFCLPTSSGEFVAVHLSSSQKFWASLAAAIGRPELTDDPRFETYRSRTANYFELVPIVEHEFSQHTFDEWAQILTAHDVPFAPVHTMESWLNDPQVDWLELVEPEKNGVSLVRPPWRFDGTRPERETHAPKVGEHTREIAAEVYDSARVEELIGTGVLFTDG